MKKILLSLLGAVVFVLLSYAANYMRVERVDGLIDDFDVDQIERVSFSKDETSIIIKNKNGGSFEYKTEKIERISFDSLIYGDREYVDLGLSVMWSTTPMENIYSWGEVAPKASHNNLNYEWCVGNYLDGNLTKYCTQSCSGFKGYYDNLTSLSPIDDAAVVNWGYYWRTPSDYEWQELIDNCVWTWEGDGYDVTGPNGNSIFIHTGHYWTKNASCQDACKYQITKDFKEKTFSFRYEGNAIIPVIGSVKHHPVYTISFFREDSTLIKSFRVSHGQSIESNAVNPPSIGDGGVGFLFAGWSESIENITSNKNVYATYKKINIKIPVSVDLGLSVKWASFNLGAEDSVDYGMKFFWGQIDPKSDNPDYETTSTSGTTYSRSYGDPKVLLPADDAATCLLGKDWHIPTFDEWSELKHNCEWTKMKINGVEGFKVTGKNGNWIFLPDTDYWTSEVDSEQDAFALECDYYGTEIRSAYKASLKSIRAVCFE